jgi:hypothetical protein
MFTLIRLLGWRELLVAQLPAFLTALLIAETYYKFGSFLLETGAFLATWYAVDGLLTLGHRALDRRRGSAR